MRPARSPSRTPAPATLAELIRERELGLGALASAIKISKPKLSKITNGRLSATPEVLHALARELRLTNREAELLYWAGVERDGKATAARARAEKARILAG